MNSQSITETFVEKAKTPATGETFYRDRNIRGFALRVNWGGTNPSSSKAASTAASAGSPLAAGQSCPSRRRAD